MNLKLWIAASLLAVVACTTTTETSPAAQHAAYRSVAETSAGRGDVAVKFYSQTLMQQLTSAAASSTPILPRLTDLKAKDRALVKAREIAKLATRGRFVSQYGTEVELGQVEEITGGVQVLARAWAADGKPIGFGRDGSVEWERFLVYNPPIMVPDGTKQTIVIGGQSVEVDTFKEDAVAALREVIAHNIKLVGKPGAKVTPGKIGNTTSTFYPDADVESTSVDGEVSSTQNSWVGAHDSANGTGADDASAQDWGAAANRNSGSEWRVVRGFVLFDSASIPDIDTISAATASLWPYAKIDGDNDADSWINFYTATPASNTALVTADFDQIGTVAQATEIDITAITTGAYNDWTLNATGLTNISKTGITKLSIREGHDATNNAPDCVPACYNQINIQYADTAGTTNDPKLVVTHAFVAADDGFGPFLIAGD